MTDDQIYRFWLERECLDAIVAGDMRAQFISAARALLAAAAPAQGWKLVPVEPTPLMLTMAAKTPGVKAIDSSSGIMQARGYPLDPAAFEDGPALVQAWRAMLAAAPIHEAGAAQ